MHVNVNIYLMDFKEKYKTYCLFQVVTEIIINCYQINHVHVFQMFGHSYLYVVFT